MFHVERSLILLFALQSYKKVLTYPNIFTLKNVKYVFTCSRTIFVSFFRYLYMVLRFLIIMALIVAGLLLQSVTRRHGRP